MSFFNNNLMQRYTEQLVKYILAGKMSAFVQNGTAALTGICKGAENICTENHQ
jgi:hypothetical protein